MLESQTLPGLSLSQVASGVGGGAGATRQYSPEDRGPLFPTPTGREAMPSPQLWSGLQPAIIND